MLSSLLDSLKKHNTSEKRNTTFEDSLLIGKIDAIRKLLNNEASLKEEFAINEGLLHELFFNCLFPTLSSAESAPVLLRSESQEGTISDALKCKTKESRTAAYKLLTTLCQNSIKCQSYLVSSCLEPLCQSIKGHHGWAYIPSSESRSKLGYSGLENLGCICYMISMLQQFYMVPTFRNMLMAVDDKRPPTNTKPDEVDDNVLHQLQKMFAFLELTERQDYSPAKFCFAFKDPEGKPTNIGIQQDAHEFLNVVFDRLENLMVKTPDKYLVNSIFGGKTCSQIICKGGCGSVKKNYEDFYNLSLGVKGNKNLSEALIKYITGDTISDYFCDKCKKKVDVVKRTCVHDLPNVLIVHLQRIIFNFDTMMNEKINSKLEFPNELDLEPYTVEYLEKIDANNAKTSPIKEEHEGPPVEEAKVEKDPSYYKYKLAGVVVHYGTADAGHYYSYINTNRGSILHYSIL